MADKTSDQKANKIKNKEELQQADKDFRFQTLTELFNYKGLEGVWIGDSEVGETKTHSMELGYQCASVLADLNTKDQMIPGRNSSLGEEDSRHDWVEEDGNVDDGGHETEEIVGKPSKSNDQTSTLIIKEELVDCENDGCHDTEITAKPSESNDQTWALILKEESLDCQHGGTKEMEVQSLEGRAQLTTYTLLMKEEPLKNNPGKEKGSGLLPTSCNEGSTIAVGERIPTTSDIPLQVDNGCKRNKQSYESRKRLACSGQTQPRGIEPKRKKTVNLANGDEISVDDHGNSCSSRSWEIDDDVSMSLNSNECQESSHSGKQTYKKPYRYCIFCKKFYSKLRKHQELKHRNAPRVKNALKLGKRDQDIVFDTFRKEGILEFNKQEKLKNPESPKLQRERKKQDDGKKSCLVTCNICHAFIEEKYRYRHQQMHSNKSDISVRVAAIPPSKPTEDVETSSIDVPTSTTDNDYASDVLSQFRTDEVGCKCVSDELLMEYGQTMYKAKRKKDKTVEVRRQVMIDVRRLATLHLHLQQSEDVLGKLPDREGTILDLLKHSNFEHLQEAIDRHTNSVSDTKAGLKTSLYHLLKSTSKILTGMFLIDDEDEKADAMGKFGMTLETHKHFFLGDATDEQNKSREEKMKRSEQQILEEDVHAVWCYSRQRIVELEEEELDPQSYIELRNLVVCRLVLFNARRGGEPTRLLVRDWEEADSNAWLNRRDLKGFNVIDTSLAKTLKVGYHSRNGRHLVPTLLPRDTHNAIWKLTNPAVRRACGIAARNSYLFPSGCYSDNHVSGWHAVADVCNRVSILNRDLFTAPKYRHRVSTKFALLDVSPWEREYVSRCLGLRDSTGIHVSQAPLAVTESTAVGGRLQESGEARVDDVSKLPDVAKEESDGDGAFQQATEGNDDTSSLSSGEVEWEKSAKQNGVRGYTHWNMKSMEKACGYFQKYIMGEASKKLPGRQDVETFLKQNPTFPIRDWMVIKTKVMNERNKLVRKLSEQEL